MHRNAGPQSSGGQSAVQQWRLLPMHVGESAQHMLMTDMLARGAGTGGPAVWWHTTGTATILVGPSAMRAWKSQSFPLGIPLVRRPTGGGAVLAGPGLLGVDVALPASHRLLTGDVVEDYAWIGRVWASTLTHLGIPARSISIEEARRLTGEASSRAREAALACFGTYSPYEVVSDGRKVLGLSQVRRNGGVVFSSALHVDLRPGELANALPLTVAGRRRLGAHLARHAASLNEVATSPVTASDIRSAFRRSLWTHHGVRLRPADWTWSEVSLSSSAPTAARSGNRLLPL